MDTTLNINTLTYYAYNTHTHMHIEKVALFQPNTVLIQMGAWAFISYK